MNLPRLLLAAPASGSGKTSLTLALLRALVDGGRRPAAFKCGPDYIDPMFHRRVLGTPGGNLDLFFVPPGTATGLLGRYAESADMAVIEAAMGYYDGVGGGDQASGWHFASVTGTPTVLVIRPGGAMLSVAALIQGFLRFRNESLIRGVLLNGCSPSMAERLAHVVERETGLRVYGCLPELPEARIESRHLGLLTPDAVTALGEKAARLAECLRENADVEALAALASEAPPLPVSLPAIPPPAGPTVRIAVAEDEAFSFYYRENFDLLRLYGADLVFFSPLADAALPENIGGLYLGGGYPEVHAARLSANTGMLASVRQAVRSGLPTLAECGGFLYLLSRLADPHGIAWPMAGVFPGSAANAGRSRRFGYVTLRARRDNLLCRRGEELPAHEYHYWDTENAGDAFAAVKPAGGPAWDCIHASETLVAGFPHWYFWSRPDTAGRFVAAARRRQYGE